MTAPNVVQPPWSVRLWQYRDTPTRGWTTRLFSDTNVQGTPDSESVGPYRIASRDAPPDHQPGQLRPVMELASWFRDPGDEAPASDSAGWTGLSIHQEITAMLSLILGVRLRGDDPVIHRNNGGTITSYHPSTRSVPSAPTSPWASPIIPDLPDTPADTASARGYLESLPGLAPQHAVDLVRAARQYADALWIAEGEPELAWLMLVSAVEVAATSQQVATADYAQLVTSGFPLAAEALVERGGDELLVRAADTEFAGLIKATGRFLAFACAFQPDPPEPRTADQAAQLPWSRRGMEGALKKVYEYRSARLHAGAPFPWPLLIPPPIAGDGLPAERFTNGPYGSGDTTWSAEELPMTLALFAHLVRGMLLRWWSTMADGASAATA
ncbi:hypothetical protein [Streptomyces sp. GbtcB7]|uniref:hypothetical protein n=1 Tax=Streptomyces sp. GbtcB7 TaxID=2824752 RepID=UPI001C2F380D|nr:hypothetical protein [Streptomyces sp. GbtcB7]